MKSRFEDGMDVMFGRTFRERLFWIPAWIIGFSITIGGAWLGTRLIEESSKVLWGG